MGTQTRMTMQMPNVKNTLIDSGSGVTYHVMAYRQLTLDEIVLSVRHYWNQNKKSKIKPGTVITIVSIIGHNSIT